MEQPRAHTVTERKGQHLPWLAFLWGLAEATVFFIVPDVLITRLALLGAIRRTLLACLCALAGALLGGTILWCAAAHNGAPSLLRLFSHLPGINRDLVAETGQAMYQQGPNALFGQGFLGHPYKLLAVHAGAQHVPLGTFLLISAPARFLRLSLTATLAWVIGRCLKRWKPATLAQCHAFVWLCFYALYFFLVGR
ncbi:MAG: hypothetical protein ABIO94_08935 [Opitutaceae bacterium]